MLGRDTGMYFRLCCCSLYELALDDDGGGRGPRSSWVGCCKRYRRSPWAAVGVIVETRKVGVMLVCCVPYSVREFRETVLQGTELNRGGEKPIETRKETARVRGISD